MIYCSDRAQANGFSYACSHEWSNLGQGAPEVGPIPDAPNRPTSVEVPVDSLEYAPTTGVKGRSKSRYPPLLQSFLSIHSSRARFFSFLSISELREAVANYYNQTYRQGKVSQYTHENVCIVPGGRAGLSRVAAVIGDVYTVSPLPPALTYSVFWVNSLFD